MGSLSRFHGFATIQIHGEKRGSSSSYIKATATNSLSKVYANEHHPSFSMVVDIFETRMAALEGGIDAIATASGQAAQMVTILTLARSGDNIIASSSMYGGTWNQFAVTFKQFGIEVKFVSTVDPAVYAASIDINTKAIYIESIANPKFVFHSIRDLAEIAHNAGIPLVVDNTLGMGGYIVRPIEHGADIVVESATKWICGHGVALGGVVIDAELAGNFDWKQSGKFPTLTDISLPRRFAFADIYGRRAFAAKVREDTQHHLGTAMGSFSATLMLQGLETLSLRADRHCSNAYGLAKWLKQHANVSWVSYLGLEGHESHSLASKYLTKGLYGSVLTFGVKGGSAAADKVIVNLRLASHLANLGDTKTLVIRPSGTTQGTTLKEMNNHSTDDADAMIRVSVGIETLDDIIADFSNALEAVYLK